jgi:hypothetical protein
MMISEASGGEERQQGEGGRERVTPPARTHTEASDPRRATTPSVGHRARHFPPRGSGGSAASWCKVAHTRFARLRMPAEHIGGQLVQGCTYSLRHLERVRSRQLRVASAGEPTGRSTASGLPAQHLSRPAHHHHCNAGPQRSQLRQGLDAAEHVGEAGRPVGARLHPLLHASWPSYFARCRFSNGLRHVSDGLRRKARNSSRTRSTGRDSAIRVRQQQGFRNPCENWPAIRVRKPPHPALRFAIRLRTYTRVGPGFTRVGPAISHKLAHASVPVRPVAWLVRLF